jgi:MFS family permease
VKSVARPCLRSDGCSSLLGQCDGSIKVRVTESRYKWVVIALLWFVCLFNYADRQGIFSVFPLLKAEMGLTDVELGIVGAAFMWVYAAAAPFAGIVGDRFQRKTLIIGGLIFWSLITIATAASTKYLHLVIFRALEGFGEAFYFPASMSLISDHPGERHAVSRHVDSSIERLCRYRAGRNSRRRAGSVLRMALQLLLIWRRGHPARDCPALDAPGA